MKTRKDEEQEKRVAHLEKTMYSLWLKETGESNEGEIEHLKHAVQVAIRECLTQRQREYLSFYLTGYNQIEIVQEFNVNKSTVSRTLKRAFNRLFSHVKYASDRTLKASERVRKNITKLYR